jgi:Cell wall-associated hydrolases (invasion-associated proteins)
MDFGVNFNSVIPLRAKPDERSEMISQILLGEMFSIEDKKNGFRKIINFADNYSGWVDEKAITPISEEEMEIFNQKPTFCVIIPLAEGFDLVDKCVIRIPGGSRLPNCDSIGRFGIQGKKFQVHRDYILSESEQQKDGLIQTALSFINTPYMWGGKTVLGMDCSGLVQVIYGIHGYKLPRDSKDQAAMGENILLQDIFPGDLAFFQDKSGNIVHVGILISQDKIIHASGRVKVDVFNKNGIYSNEQQKQTHTLHSIKRIN